MKAKGTYRNAGYYNKTITKNNNTVLMVEKCVIPRNVTKNRTSPM